MTDYERGRRARLGGEPLSANPYWGWFRRVAWERGWVDGERLCATTQTAPVVNRQSSHPNTRLVRKPNLRGLRMTSAPLYRSRQP